VRYGSRSAFTGNVAICPGGVSDTLRNGYIADFL